MSSPVPTPPAARLAWEALSSTAVSGRLRQALAATDGAELALRAGDLRTRPPERTAAAVALTLGYLGRARRALDRELEHPGTLRPRREPDLTPSVITSPANSCSSPPRTTRCFGCLGRRGRRPPARQPLPRRHRWRLGGQLCLPARQAGRHVGDYAQLLDYFDRTGSITQQMDRRPLPDRGARKPRPGRGGRPSCSARWT